jgi:hypothetical protein
VAFPEGFTEALAQARAMELRPLDLAGILSRAATIYAGNAWRFIAMVFTAIVPLTIMQYFIARGEQPQIDATIAWLQLPQNVQATHIPPGLASPNVLLFASASFAVTYLLLGFAMAAAGAGLAAYNRNEKISYGACMCTAVRRWQSITGAVLLVLALGVAATAAVVVGILIPLAAVAALAPAAIPLMSAFGMLALLVVLCFAVTMLLVVGAATIYAATLEDCSPSDALRRTLRRTCNRGELWRALVCASIVSAIVIAATAGVDILGFALLQHRAGLYLALDAAVRAVVVAFADIVFAVYYFDLRVRQEGYDLAMRVDYPGMCAVEGIDYAPTRYLSGEERALVVAFIERRASLSPLYRRNLAARIVAPARTRVPDELAAMDDEALLERL